MTFELGQELWFVPSFRQRGAKPYTVRITKIGTKWIHLDKGFRILKDDMFAEGTPSPGRCFTLDEYRKEIDLSIHWSNFKQDMQFCLIRPKNLTAERIIEARKLIFGE